MLLGFGLVSFLALVTAGHETAPNRKLLGTKPKQVTRKPKAKSQKPKADKEEEEEEETKSQMFSFLL